MFKKIVQENNNHYIQLGSLWMEKRKSGKTNIFLYIVFKKKKKRSIFVTREAVALG